MKFSYIALNPDHQKLTGILSAEDKEEAREKLHALSLSIVSLQQEADDAEVTNDLPGEGEEAIITYIFHVYDPKQNEVRGSIDAPDRKTAYHRLMSEYKFRIISLCDESVPEEIREEEGRKGLEDIAEEVKFEFGISEKDLLDSGMEIESHVNEANEEARKEIVANVEQIVARAEEILEKFDEELTGDEVHAVRNKIDTLMRIRLSNNLKYIQDLADELLVAIDTTMQQHLDTVITNQDDSFKDTGKNLDEAGRLAYFRDLTSRMTNLVDGYNKSKRKLKRRRKKSKTTKVKKPITNPAIIRTILVFKNFKKLLGTMQRLIFSKSSVVRKQYVQQLKEHLREFIHIFKIPDYELIPGGVDAANMVEALAKEKVERGDTAKHEQTLFYRLLQEFHLFFGWLLAFYIVYFYFSVYVLVKWGSDSPFFEFVYRSLSSPFPFLTTGFFFLIFLGLTMALRIAKGRIIPSSFMLLVTVLTIVVMIFNF